MPEQKQTLEQQRARDAWDKAQDCGKDYVNLAKGLPTLIINSGLMQVMAFLHEKGKGSNSDNHHAKLAKHLRSWLHQRFPKVPTEFTGFMEALMQADPQTYQDITTEAFAWLRWMRQMAPARNKEN